VILAPDALGGDRAKGLFVPNVLLDDPGELLLEAPVLTAGTRERSARPLEVPGNPLAVRGEGNALDRRGAHRLFDGRHSPLACRELVGPFGPPLL